MTNNDYYSLSSADNTFIEIKAIKSSDSMVAYELNCKLISSASQEYLQLKDVVLEITGENFKSLII